MRWVPGYHGSTSTRVAPLLIAFDYIRLTRMADDDDDDDDIFESDEEEDQDTPEFRRRERRAYRPKQYRSYGVLSKVILLI